MFDTTSCNLARVLMVNRRHTTKSCALPLAGRWAGLRPLRCGKQAPALAGAAL
jgi:hypothetical protein